MNTKPHTHDVSIGRQRFNLFPPLEPGYWLVGYGDTEVRVHRGPWLERRLKRGVARAIRRHDAGSILAGRIEARNDRVVRSAMAAAKETVSTVGGWPSGLGNG